MSKLLVKRDKAVEALSVWDSITGGNHGAFVEKAVRAFPSEWLEMA